MALMYVSWILIGLQVVVAITLILIIAFQTTKSESSGSGMGWGTIGGQASSTVKFGFEEQITRLTTRIAVLFFVLSVVSAWVHTMVK